MLVKLTPCRGKLTKKELSHHLDKKLKNQFTTIFTDLKIRRKPRTSNTGVSNSTMLAGHILMKKELAGRTMRQKCLRGPQKGVKSATIPHKTVVSTITKGILMITRAA